MVATRRTYLRELLATLALVLAVVVPVAHGQSVVAVSNRSQAIHLFSDLQHKWAQGFVTGSNPAGYTLTSIEFYFSSANPAPNELTVQLWSASGTEPGQPIATLSNPGDLATEGGRFRTFTAPADTRLRADTRYFAYVHPGTFNEDLPIGTGVETGEDAGGLPGWSIDDGSRRAEDTGAWTVHSLPLLMSVNVTFDPPTPLFRSAVVNGKRLTITFLRNLVESAVPAPAAFEVTVGTNDAVSPAEVEVAGATVVLTLDSPVTDGDAVKVAYDILLAGGNPLLAATGDGVAAFADEDATNETPSGPPVLSSVTIASVPSLDADGDGAPDTYGPGETIFVDAQFDQPVAVDDGGAADNVFVWLDMAPNNALRLDENRRAFPFQGLGRDGKTMRFQYTVEAADRDADGVFVQRDPEKDTVVFLRGAASVQSPTTDRFAVLELAEQGPAFEGDPGHRVDGGLTAALAFERATVDGTTLTITFNKTLDASSAPAGDAFTVSGGRTGTGTATVSGATVTVTLGSAVPKGETVTVSYEKPGINPLQDIAGRAVPSFSGRAVSNRAVGERPVADAGDDVEADPGARVTLDGTKSTDPDGSRLTFAWTQTAGERVTLSGADSARLSFTAPAAAGVLTFRLTVTNADGLSDSDEVTVLVGDAGERPVADAGDDVEADPGARVTLDGTKSTDPDGSRLTFAWTQTAGERVTLSGADSARLSFTAPAAAGVLTFRLTVTNTDGLSDSDEVTVLVGDAGERPVADAGDDVEADPGARVTLDGTKSTDPDGGRLTFAWTQTAGERVTLSGADSARLSFTAPAAAGVLTFRLTVTDPDGMSHSDEVTVLVDDVRPPVAYAGDDVEADPGARVTLDGTKSTNPKGGGLTFAWTQTAGERVTPSGERSARLSFTAPAAAGALTFRLTVTDPDGLSDSDEVTVTVRDIEVSFGDAAVATLALTGGTMEPVRLPEASGGNGRLRYSLTSKPAGLAGLDFDPATRWLTGTPAGAGTFTFTLRATDGDGDTAAVVFLVRVNRAPVARAGDDLTVEPGAPARLDGSGSSDPDGDILTFAWTQTLGSRVTLSDATDVRPSFEAPWRPEPLVFRLTVTDPDGLSDSDEVTVTVRDLAPTFGDAEVAPLVLDAGHEMEAVVLPAASGGNGALGYGLTSEPAGLAGLDFDPAARRLSGTPDAKGQHVFTYRAEDADDNREASDAALLTFTVTVQAPVEARKQVLTRTLAAVGAGALSSALDTIGSRFADAMPGTNVTLAGRQLSFAAPGGSGGGAGGTCPAGGFGRHDFGGGAFGGGVGRAGIGTAAGGCAGGPGAAGHGGGDAGWDDLLRSSAFSLALGDGGADAAGPRWGVWGGGDLMAFEGRPDPGSRYRGEARTGWLGIDAREGRWVAGLAVSHGVSRSDYGFAGGEDADERGRLETTLTTFYPYGRWTLGNGLELRALAGAGLGAARHRVEEGVREASDLSMSIGSVGVRQALPAVAGVDLAVRADASFARLGTGDGEQAIDGLQADVWRGRMGLEVSRRIVLGAGPAIEPFVESAMRRDGGDGLTGNGVEHLAGVRLLTARLQVEARGRLLAVHTDAGARERGVSVTARLAPRRDGRGLSLALMPQWGAATGAAEALWREEMPRLHGTAGRGSGTLDANLGYGLALAARGVLTPFAAARLSGYGRGLRLGTRFAGWQEDLDVELSGERRESAVAAPRHGVRLDVRLRF